jgi:hypothetical protein
MIVRPWLVLSLSVSLALCATRTHAQDAPSTGASDAVALDARAAELERALADVQRPTRMYFAGWMSALAALAVGQGIIAFTADGLPKGQREGMWLGAGLSVVGVGIMGITPFPGRYGAEELRGMPANTLAEKRAKVARGEELLEGEADSAWFQRAWFQHPLLLAAGAGVGLFLGLRNPDELWTAAIPNAVGTFVVAEMQVWTRPKAVIGHWERYRAHVPQLNVAPMVAQHASGLVLHARF